MKKLLIFLVIVVCAALIIGAGEYATDNYTEQGGARTVIGGSLDVVSGGELDIESGGALRIAGTAITATAAEINKLAGVTAGTGAANKALVLGSGIDANVTAMRFTNLKVLEGGGTPTYTTTFTGGDQSGNLTLTLPTGYAASSGYVLSSTDAGVLTWVANAGIFTGGSITSDCVLSNGVDLMSTEADAEAATIKVYDTDTGYANVLSWTNGSVPAIVLGAATNTLALVSSGGLNVTTAGAVTGATGITNTGTIANTGALNNTGAITQTGGIVSFNAASNYAVNINTGGSTGATSIGGGSGTVAIDTTSWDITSGGVGSGFSGLTFLTGSAIRASSTTAETLAFQAYDTDAIGYENSILLTNGTVPAITIGVGTDTLAINTTTWDVTSAGAMSGLTGLVATGTISLNDTASTATTSIGGGTTTGAVSVGTGASIQTINIATGGAAKTATFGSINGTSATTVQSGNGDLNLTSTDAITMTSAGIFNIGANEAAQTITVGNETGATALHLLAGSGNIDIQGVAGTTITIGDAAQTGAITIGASTATMTDLSLGTGVGAHTIHIGDGGTAAQVITIGSTSVASAVTIQAGTGKVTMSSAGTGADAFNIDTTAGGIDIDIAGAADGEDFDVTANSSIQFNSSQAVADAIKLNASDAAGGITVAYGTGNMAITGTGASADFTLDCDLFSIDGTGAANISVTGSAGEDLTISQLGAGVDASVIISSAGIGTDAIKLNATAGGVDIDGVNDVIITCASTAAGDDLALNQTGAVNASIILTAAGTGVDAISLQAAAGGIDIDGVNDVIITCASTTTGDDLALTQTGAVDAGIILTAAGTGADAIGLSATAGGITLNSGSTGVNFSGDIIKGFSRSVTDDTDNETLTTAQSGGIFTNQADTDTQIYTLPAAATGLIFTFCDVEPAAGRDLCILAAGDDTINGGVAGQYYNCYNDTAGDSVTIVAISATEWVVIAKVGTWTNDSDTTE